MRFYELSTFRCYWNCRTEAFVTETIPAMRKKMCIRSRSVSVFYGLIELLGLC